MASRKTLRVATLALGITLGLTACDPPMPASLLVAQAELEVQCEEGNASLSVPEAISDLGFTWSDSLSYGCENMTISLDDPATSDTALIISEASLLPETCKPFAQIPVAVDAAVLVVNIPDVYEIYLSPEQILGIFDGSISSWSDPALAINNEGYVFPELPIILPTEATASAKASLSDWINRLSGKKLDLSSIADLTGTSEIFLAAPEQEGSVSIASYSSALYSGSPMAYVVTESGNIESTIIPDSSTIGSAASQVVSVSDGEKVSFVLDPSIEPVPDEGSFEAAVPYQAIYAVNLALCGEDNLLTRTAARFILRQDSQGIIASGTMYPLPEKTRIESILIAAKGLAIPNLEETKK
jgi:ABC-type phosphate transport system substrate-binding protein